MRLVLCSLLLVSLAVGQNQVARVSRDDSVRVQEFYRLAAQIQDQIWPHWSQTPSPLLLVANDAEFLTHHPSVPSEFKPTNDGFSTRPRQFSTNLLATFPAFGPPSVIVIGEPANTSSKTSTPWLITVMHEHFHQLQESQPGYYEAVAKLDLSKGDNTGMWMLNYPFPYDKPEVVAAFNDLRDLLLRAVTEPDNKVFTSLAHDYVQKRKQFFASVSPNDAKYLEFQLWKEGIARYTQIKTAEAAENYHPTSDYQHLSDFTSFSDYASHVRNDTLDELKRADLREWKREVVYSFGAAEGLLLDRLHPNWKDEYFKHPLSMDSFF